MEQIRARVDAIVKDPKTAAALKPYYPYGCKRPTFHDEFLPTFNLPHVHLVDTAPTRRAADQRERRRARRRGISARRADLRDRLPVDGDLDVQHDHGPRRPHAARQVERRKARRPSSACTATASRTCSSCRVRRAAAAASTSPTPSTRTPTTSCGCSRRCANAARRIVDIQKEPEIAYAEHCREADIATAPFRDCLSYYNGEGDAEPGSLAYYGGPDQWHKLKNAAQASMDAYVFETGRG